MDEVGRTIEMREFTAIAFPDSRKIFELTPDGIAERLIFPPKDLKTPAGVWVFGVPGTFKLHAVPIREAEPHEKTELFDKLKLPQVGVLPVLKTSVWFCLPLNENQYQKYIKPKKIYARMPQFEPLPLFFAPENISIFDPLLVRVYKHRRTLLIFEDYHDRYPREKTDYLRQMLDKWIKSSVKVESYDAGFPRELFNAFQIAKETQVPPLERLVKYSLKLAEAKFQSLIDLGNGQHRVDYSYKGHSDSVVIDENLTVLDSGICLSGRDRDFDLSSVVLVKYKGRN